MTSLKPPTQDTPSQPADRPTTNSTTMGPTVQIRLPPAAVPLAFHATLSQGQGPMQLAGPGPGSLPLGPADASGMLPFPQPRRPGYPLDPHDCMSNSGLPLMVSTALPSAASASLPCVASNTRAPSPGSKAAAAAAANAAAAAAAVGAAAAAAAEPDGSSGQQTETEGVAASLDGDSLLQQQQQAQQQQQQQAQHPEQPQPQQQQQQAAQQARRTVSQGPRRGSSSAQPANNNNGMRKSKYRGVQWEKSCNKWRARIHTDKTRHIGYFDDEADAAQAWDLAALKHFGLAWQAKLNFPEESVKRFQREPNAAGPAARGDAGGGAPGGVRQYRGVQQVDNKFKAVVQKQRTQITVGVFDTAEAAARAYDRESLRLNGRGAITNFPLQDYAEELERWQEAYNLVTSCDLGSMPIPTSHAPAPAPSGPQPCATHTHPLSAGGTAETYEGGATGPTAAWTGPGDPDASIGGGGAAVAGARGELPAVTSGGRLLPVHCLPGEFGSGGSKRKRLDMEGLAGAPASLPGSPFDFPGAPSASASASTNLNGVVKVGNRWQAYLAVDLGTYASPEEAARAHDRASLRVHGFSAQLNSPLAEALAEARATCAAQQQADGGGAGPAAFKGVVARDGAFLALLDIDGSQYELGPFPSELEAAQAQDRYSLLLHGLSAQTNFPTWGYLAPDKEVQALVAAVQTVAGAKRKREGGLGPAEAGRAAAVAQQRPAAQQQGQDVGLGGAPPQLDGSIWEGHPFRHGAGGGYRPQGAGAHMAAWGPGRAPTHHHQQQQHKAERPAQHATSAPASLPPMAPQRPPQLPAWLLGSGLGGLGEEAMAHGGQHHSQLHQLGQQGQGQGQGQAASHVSLQGVTPSQQHAFSQQGQQQAQQLQQALLAGHSVSMLPPLGELATLGGLAGVGLGAGAGPSSGTPPLKAELMGGLDAMCPLGGWRLPPGAGASATLESLTDLSALHHPPRGPDGDSGTHAHTHVPGHAMLPTQSSQQAHHSFHG